MAADKENPYSKAPKGESADARKTRQTKFYRQQRVNAEETGDQAKTDKIYGKLGKKSHSVDADKVNKIALAAIPAAAGGIGAAAGALGRAGAGAAGRAALTAGAGVARKALGAGEKTAAKSVRQNLGRARPVKKAIGGQKSLPSNRKVSAKVERPSALSGGKTRAAKPTTSKSGYKSSSKVDTKKVSQKGRDVAARDQRETPGQTRFNKPLKKYVKSSKKAA